MKPGCKASGGEIGSENVDMSSDKQGETLSPKVRVPVKANLAGWPTPKARPKGVVDGTRLIFVD